MPLQFVKPLSDVEVIEGQTATLECVVSRPDQTAKWLRKGKPLPKDNRITITVDKSTHKLVIQSATLDDAAEYSVKIGDKVSKATVFVEGMKFHPLNHTSACNQGYLYTSLTVKYELYIIVIHLLNFMYHDQEN